MAVKRRPRRESGFYVFYDKYDNVRCFGTAKQLVREGYFPSRGTLRSTASKLKDGKLPGAVVILPLE